MPWTHDRTARALGRGGLGVGRLGAAGAVGSGPRRAPDAHRRPSIHAAPDKRAMVMDR